MSKCLNTNDLILIKFILFVLLLLFIDTEIFADYAGSCLFFEKSEKSKISISLFEKKVFTNFVGAPRLNRNRRNHPGLKVKVDKKRSGKTCHTFWVELMSVTFSVCPPVRDS